MCTAPPTLEPGTSRDLLTFPRFMAFHPPAFLVKVNIEMSMADLILKIARSKEFTASNLTTNTYELSHYASRIDPLDDLKDEAENIPTKFSVVRTQEVRVEAESTSQSSFNASGEHINGLENDEQPLHGTRMGIYTTEVSSGVGEQKKFS